MIISYGVRIYITNRVGVVIGNDVGSETTCPIGISKKLLRIIQITVVKRNFKMNFKYKT